MVQPYSGKKKAMSQQSEKKEMSQQSVELDAESYRIVEESMMKMIAEVENSSQALRHVISCLDGLEREMVRKERHGEFLSVMLQMEKKQE